eukprot:XP_015577483.1 uncharacterized protein LOC8262877 isoform X2 [Ricinus communis]
MAETGDSIPANTITIAVDSSNSSQETNHSQNNDSSGMHLISILLNENNYIPWNRSMKLALGAKDKLGYINGENAEPASTAKEYKLWKKTDCLIAAWILKSISKEHAEGFIYCSFAKDLWEEIQERLGESNGPLEYQIQLEINNLKQVCQKLTILLRKKVPILLPTILNSAI